MRSHIEDVYTLAKEAFALWAVRRHSRLSVAKLVARNLLLVVMIVLAGINEKSLMQSVAEWQTRERTYIANKGMIYLV